MRGTYGTNHRYAAIALAVAVALGVETAGQQPPSGRTAAAEIKNADGKTIGRAELQETPNGVLLHVKLMDAPAGVHALHLHETGRCEVPSFESAGGHFNPTSAGHGFKDAMGPHAGDLPNVHIGRAGAFEVEVLAAKATLDSGKTGLLDSDGSALVLHAGRDDYATEPAGSAGVRIACGVVQPAR